MPSLLQDRCRLILVGLQPIQGRLSRRDVGLGDLDLLFQFRVVQREQQLSGLDLVALIDQNLSMRPAILGLTVDFTRASSVPVPITSATISPVSIRCSRTGTGENLNQ